MKMFDSDANYIYERVNNTIYVRKSGEDPSTRTIKGHVINSSDDYFLENEWVEILKESETNPSLQLALNHVKLIYYLGKKDEKE
jgi:hypothetical protein